ncbi:Helix-turn-helix domain protein [Posidoniimonas polymericola]|uniref:Helix-turn-helix domain protein n=1 Tax=Posidoniimonas polymericola TaxID=2528002 RepID=A0A5C5XXE0_9BACT|nr:helix-turn-helix domain-containing protein [Posidoniimonas polymericola]TWT67023.1 Helix-turn-helix domain protein [Posidoniimonas polymericola]
MDKNDEKPAARKPPTIGDNACLLATPTQVAEMLQVSTRTLWRMRAAGKLPEPVRLGAAVRWRRDEIEQWVRDGCPAHCRRIDGFRSR